ncbi:TonB-dependent receptor [Niabella sp.]|uniref:SusC/RagA family TonB-linked outer membrane protein n=1 Tax=Niabella sp. TaxID=1962976 RepID=UPI00260C0D01|nr:TonB-dependent receptor [Niabella sp.]
MNSFIRKRDLLIPVLLLAIQLSFGFTATAQELISVKGTVTDRATGKAIAGASISVKGRNGGTLTDSAGNFQLRLAGNTLLTISSIGYKTAEIKTDQPVLAISLDPVAENLGEVVVIGYGQVKKGDATGALATLKPDPLNKGLQVTPQDALVGKIAGVNIVPGSGAPGSEGIIRIRMGASLSASNDPLIVIDGVPTGSGAPLSSINPNDIETFTVLKDASATAIYGSRASNGVIIITTKKGSINGSKPHINYTSNITLSQVPHYYDVLSADEYRNVFTEKANAPADFQLGTANTNWQKEIYQTAIGNDHNLSVTGNSGQLPYRLSAGYTNQNGILKENKYQRTNLGLGLSPKFLNRHLSLDINLKGSIERERPVSNGVIGSAITFDPTRPVYQTYPDSTGLGYYVWMNGGKPVTLAASNPVADLELADKLDLIKRSIGNIAVDYKVHGFEDLRLNMNLGYDVRKRDYSETIPDKAPSMYTSNRNDGRGRFLTQDDQNTNYIFTAYANYVKKITPLHKVDAMAGYEWQRFWYKTVPKSVVKGVDDTSVPDEDVLYLLSFFGRVNYSFGQKILLTGTLRADASSRFSPQNRWGYFPSAALAYRLADENFIRNSKTISDLKLRLSYGQTGQQDIGGYHPYLASYTISTDAARYRFGDSWLNMYRPNGYDPNIRWETTSTYNLGIDFGFLKNRIFGSIDLYNRYTRDLLNRIAVPAGSNFTNIIETNIGDMESKGFEIALGGTPIKKTDFEWSINGNFTYGTAKIKKLNTIDTENNYVKTGTISRNDFQVQKVGETPNTFFLLKQAYDDSGKPLEGKYVSKDGSITSSEQDANKYITGKSSRVPYYYGTSTRLRYKRIDMGINGHGSFGNYVFNYQQANQAFISLFSSEKVSSNISRAALNRGFTQQRYFSDLFLENGAFYRLDNITLGYTLPKLWKEDASLRIALSAQNVHTFTNYSGVDPEIYTGLDNNIYQRPRIYTLSFNLNF